MASRTKTGNSVERGRCLWRWVSQERDWNQRNGLVTFCAYTREARATDEWVQGQLTARRGTAKRMEPWMTTMGYAGLVLPMLRVEGTSKEDREQPKKKSSFIKWKKRYV